MIFKNALREGKAGCLQLNIIKHWKYKKRHRARVPHWGVPVTSRWWISADALVKKLNSAKTEDEKTKPKAS